MIFSRSYKSKLALLMLTFSPVASHAAWIPVSDTYSYNVQVLPPFGRVLINETITCPESGSRSPFCLVSDQMTGSTMRIKGFKDHVCYLTIEQDGSVKVDAASIFCTIQSSPATQHSVGRITLPKHF